MSKKYSAIGFFLVFTVISVYSQTWTETLPNDNSIRIEFTVLTQEQFNRLLRQNESKQEYALMVFEDVLEMTAGIVVSGRRPALKGFYYFIAKMSSSDPDTQDGLVLMGYTNYLVYGHSETGEMSIVFMNSIGALAMSMIMQDVVSVGSQEYTNLFNQFVSFVNGK